MKDQFRRIKGRLASPDTQPINDDCLLLGPDMLLGTPKGLNHNTQVELQYPVILPQFQ